MTWEIGIALTVAIAQLIFAVATLVRVGRVRHEFNDKMDGALRAQRSLGFEEGRREERQDQVIRDAEKGMTQSQIEETIHR